MKLKVLHWESALEFHVCEDERGEKHNVDLRVGCDKPIAESNEELVGRMVECEYLQPWLELAQNTVVLEKEPVK